MLETTQVMAEMPPSPPSLFVPLSQLLMWLAKRAAPLAAATLGLAALLWLDFRRQYALPIGFASNSVLSALPSMMAIVFALVFIVTGALMTPCVVLTTRVQPQGPALATLLRTPVDPATGQRIFVRRSSLLTRYWVGSAVVACLSWIAVTAAQTIWPMVLSLTSGWCLTLAIALVLALVGIRLLAHVLGGEHPSYRFIGSLVIAQFLQSAVACCVIVMVIDGQRVILWSGILTDLFIVVAVTVILALLQMIVGLRMVRGWYPNALKHGVCLALCIVGAVALIPSMGANIAAYALLSSATPGGQCSVLLFPTHHVDGASDRLMGPLPGQSKPLAFVFPFDATFYVKETVFSPTLMLSATSIEGTRACSVGERPGVKP